MFAKDKVALNLFVCHNKSLTDQPRGLIVRVCLLIMRSRVRFPVLPWEFFLAGKDSHGDRGLGS